MHRNTLKALIVAALGLIAMLAMPTLASARDRNHDHIPDRWEKRHHLSLHRNQARRDQDHDRLRNRAEFLARDNPRNPDTDNDGVKDGEENAGKIESFDPGTGRLKVDLFGGDTISGVVTSNTEIECDGHGGATASEHGDETSSQQEDEAGDEEGAEDSGEASDDGDHSGEEADDDAEHGDEVSNGETEDPGDEAGEGGEHNGNCSTAALVEGAVVREAELKVANGTATFEKVELAG